MYTIGATENHSNHVFRFRNFPVDTRRRFNVYKTLYSRLIDVETTPYVYWVSSCGGSIQLIINQ